MRRILGDCMSEIVVRIPGEPCPQNQGKIGRWKARDGREGATIRQPAKVRNYKVELQERMYRAAVRAGMAPDFAGTFFGSQPLALSVVAVFSCPTSQHRKTKPVPRRPHTGRYGNLDNLVKPIGDAGEGVLWDNDGQICRFVEPFEKWVGAQGEAPYLEIRVRPVERGGDANCHQSNASSKSMSNEAPAGTVSPGPEVQEIQPVLFKEEESDARRK